MSAHPQSARRPGSAFISYARQDGEAFAKRLRERIEREHPDLHLWQDRAEMRGGVGWWQQIEQALEQVSFLVIVMTPAALASEMTRKEWRYAREQGVCVFPVKGVRDPEIDYKALPKWMSKAHFYDLDKEWDTFIHHLKSPCTQTRVPFMAPDLPEHFVRRPRELDALLSRVVDRSRQDPIAVTTSLHGAGGFGKTMLAKALCHDDEVITAFVDGILWVTLGEKPDLRRELTRLHRALTAEEREFLDAEEAAQALARRLAEKHCLIVIDDVWRREHLEPFLRGGASCARLVTTRIFNVVAETREPVPVAEMREDEAVTLLASRLHEKPQDLSAFKALAARLGEWPLLLRLAASVIQSRVARGEPLSKALEYVNWALDKKGITAFDRADAESRDDAVSKTVGVSLDLLSQEDRRLCFELAVFPEDVEIPLSALAALWQMDEFEAEECAQRLADLALIELDLGRGLAEAQDVMRRFFAVQLSEPPAVHARLVASWGDPLALADPYALRWLCYHMAQAGQETALRTLLLDYRWLAHKLRAAGISALLDDFRFANADPVLAVIERALRQAAHVLGKSDSDWSGAEQFASQLLARLLHRTEPEIQKLLLDATAAQANQGKPWLRPLTGSLRTPSALDRTLTGHDGSVTALAVLPDRRLASGSNDGTIKLWNLATGEAEATLKEHRGAVWALALLPDGRLASGSSDKTIKLWNLATSRTEATLKRHRDGVRALALLPDGRLASGSEDDTIKLWNLATGELDATFKAESGAVWALAMLPNGQIASGSDDGAIKLWNLATRKVEAILEGHNDSVTDLAVLPDGRLASGSGDSTIQLWNLATRKAESTLEGHSHAVTALALLPDGRLASGSADGSIKLWGLATGEAETPLEWHSGSVNALALLPDGRLASGSGDNTIKLWNLTTREAEDTREGHSRWTSTLALLSEGRLASGSGDKTTKLWNLATGKPETTLKGHSGCVRALALLPDGRLASGSDDKTIKLWNLATGKDDATLKRHSSGVRALALLPDGRLASGSEDKTIKLWKLASSEAKAPLEWDSGWVNALAPLPDGRLASGSYYDTTIKVWNLATRKADAALEGHSGGVNAFALLLDGRLASGSWDKTVKLWNLATGEAEATLEGHSSPVTALAMLPDGRLASASGDRTIRIWSGRGRDWSGTVAFVADGDIEALVFAESDGILAAGDASGRVHFLKLESLPPTERHRRTA